MTAAELIAALQRCNPADVVWIGLEGVATARLLVAYAPGSVLIDGDEGAYS